MIHLNRRKRRLLKRTVLLIAAAVTVTAAVKSCRRTTREINTAPAERIITSVSTAEERDSVKHDFPDLTDHGFPFNSMSADWGEGDLDGWFHYEIPEIYAAQGGMLPDIVQVYAYCLCRQYGVDYPMVLAIIEYESGYQYNAGKTGAGLGYMQIVYAFHKERIAGMSEETLINPFINLRAGISYLAEISEKYHTPDEILTVYNMGPSGAESYWFNDYYRESPYSRNVLKITERIRGALLEREEMIIGL